MDAYVIPDQLRLRLENWRRWCLQNPAARGHCYSIEHRYRSPQWGHWDTTPPAIQGQIDALDAGRIEDAVRCLHSKQRLLVRRAWVKRWKPDWICKALRIPMKDYEETHYFSLIALNALLKTHDRQSNVIRDNSDSEPPSLLAA